MAPNAFKILQFIVFFKNKEGDPIQTGRNKGKYVLICFLIFILWVCFFFCAKITFPEVVNLDDAQKCGWKRLEQFGESVTNISWITEEQDFENENLKFTELLLQSYHSFSLIYTDNWANSRLKVSEAVFILVQTPFSWCMCLQFAFLFECHAWYKSVPVNETWTLRYTIVSKLECWAVSG